MSGPTDLTHGPSTALVLRASRALGTLGRRFYRDDEGVSMVTFALMITVILGFSALVTDVGTAYWQRRMLQNAADGGALAGASQLASNLTAIIPTPATSISQTYVVNNGVAVPEITANQVTTTFNSNDSVQVNVLRNDNWGMRYIIGAGNTNIGTGAVGLVASLAPNDLWPFGVTAGTNCDTATPNGCQLKAGAGGSLSGNFGLVCYQGTNCGTQDYIVPEIENGYNGTVPPPTANTNPPTWNWSITTEPGNKLPAANTGTSQLMTWDANKQCDGGVSCPGMYQLASSIPGLDPLIASTYQTSDKTVCVTSTACPRVGIVPLIQQTWSGLNGNTPITVVGFACFYLTKVVGNGGSTEIYGVFLRYCIANPSKTSVMYGVPLDSTGSIGVVLWQ